jgi:hypothetical protein
MTYSDSEPTDEVIRDRSERVAAVLVRTMLANQNRSYWSPETNNVLITVARDVGDTVPERIRATAVANLVGALVRIAADYAWYAKDAGVNTSKLDGRLASLAASLPPPGEDQVAPGD